MYMTFRFVPDVETARSWGEVAVWAAGGLLTIAALIKSPVGKPVRFVWQQLVTAPRQQRQAAALESAMRPMVEELKAASRAQHDEQNAMLREHSERLDRGADAINGLREEVAEIRGRLSARPPNARTRKDDQ